jgi:hypothetical protein
MLDDRIRIAATSFALTLCIACGGSDGGGSSVRELDAGFTQDSSVKADFHTLKTPPLADDQFEILTLSTLPDAVTGGDVLVAIRGLAPGDDFRVERNGDDVTGAFSRLETGEVRGLVAGLREGDNTIVAAARARLAGLSVRNHPISGPVISGPHQEPFFCRTEEAGLGPPLDDDCSVETRVQWFARSIDQRYEELANPYAPYPPTTVTTETTDGRVVPFVVRVESTTINRGIARIALLDDPASRGPDAPFDARSWNRRLYYVFGESCGVGYHQGLNDPSFVLGPIPDPTNLSADRLLINFVGEHDRLAHGDAVVHSTLSAFGVHCNPLVSVETAMMVKEYVSDHYGLVARVVGTNGSGAALQQYNAANNAPGLLSAALPTASFADIASTAMTVTDCGLLKHYYETSSFDWSDQKRAAVDGHLPVPYDLSICQSWTDTFLSRLDPTDGCDGAVPREVRYDPETNPGGVRCTVQDANVNVFGRDPATGFARRPLDNTGVQYGLSALNSGAISLAEFVDLNREIGGYDIDGKHQAERMAMAPDVEALAYRLGAVIGRGALAETPVIDVAPYIDLIPIANIHEAVRPFTIRERLRAREGAGATQSIWRGLLTQPDVYPVMEAWLDALERSEGGERSSQVIESKPAAADDRCVIGTTGGRVELPDAIIGPLGLYFPLLVGVPAPDIDVPLRLDVPEDFDSGIGICSIALPVTRTPRMVAGMPLSDDVLRCQLKPVDPADYASPPSEETLAELREIFPSGVCDWTKPAAGDVEKSLLWTSIGGETLEPPHALTWRVGRSGS